MELNSVNIPEIGNIVDEQMKIIFQKMTGLTIEEAVNQTTGGSDIWSLVISSKGDYPLTVAMCAESNVLRAIAQVMCRHKEIPEDDVPVYVSELFNILCGRIISAINTKYHYSARFTIPKFLKGPYSAADTRYYHCDAGDIQVSVTTKAS